MMRVWWEYDKIMMGVWKKFEEGMAERESDKEMY